LVGKVPIVAVTLNPNIKINKLSDFINFKVGTFQKYSTTHTIMQKLIPDKEFIPIKYNEITKALKTRKIDIGIMTLDLAYDLAGKGGHIIYNFENELGEYLFTGITISDNIDPKFLLAINSFLASIKESINYIKKNKKEAQKHFKKEFFELFNQEEMFDCLISYWHKRLTISDNAIKKAKQTWKEVYPWLLKTSIPQYINLRLEDKIIKILSSNRLSRDIPYKEDEMVKIVGESIKDKKPISLVGFWGASNKKDLNKNDIIALNNFENINIEIKKLYKPGIEYIFILADEHARANNFHKEHYAKYLNLISKKLKEYKFKSILLSSIWEEYNLDDRLINLKLKNLKDKDWKDLVNYKALEKSAKNRGLDNHTKEAKRYFVQRKIESSFISKKFPNMIYFTYSEDIHQNIFPESPTLYFWVSGSGHTKSPWFN